MLKRALTGAALAACVGAGTATAQADTIDPAFQETAMFGISNHGELKRFDFPTYSLKTIGTVQDKNGVTMSGIEASGYIPGHNNIMAFWKSPADGKTHLMYIDTQTALGTAVGQNLGDGDVTGAATGPNGTAIVRGAININPNNNDDYEFRLLAGGKAADGTQVNHVTYTRDYLHQSARCDADGMLYEGPATYVRVKPKGNGNQNSMTVDGETIYVENSKVYVITGDMQVRLWNDHIDNNNKAMGHWWIAIDGKCSVHEDGSMKYGGSTGDSPWALYAVQKTVAAAAETIDFVVDNGKVTPSESFAAKHSVLGSAVSYGGAYDMPVTVSIRAGSVNDPPFGDYDKPVDSNVNDGNNPRSHVHANQLNANTDLSVKAKVWKKKDSGASGNINSHWEVYAEHDSATGTNNVMILRDGDDVPNIPGFMDQNSIEDFVRDYIDPLTNKITLGENQAIYLFEFGDINSSAADFQDLVVLVSLAKDVTDFTDDNNPEGAASRLIKVNHKTGGYSLLMQLQNEYDSLATSDGLKFFATANDQLYLIDVVAQTETLLGTMASGGVKSLESVGTTLMGFESTGDKLMPVSSSTGGSLGTPASLGMTDLGTVIFMPVASDPALKAAAYD